MALDQSHTQLFIANIKYTFTFVIYYRPPGSAVAQW